MVPDAHVGEACFRIRGLTKRYTTTEVVLDVPELDIRQGEITALLGYSGAGKSTLLHLLGLLDDPDPPSDGVSPIVYGKDTDYLHLSERSKCRLRREHFGFVFQDHHLAGHLTARANVGMPLALKGRSRSQVMRRTAELLEAVLPAADTGHPRVWDALPFTLSGGESLRVAVLRALAHAPRVLFADEPTGSLDPVTGRKVMSLIDAYYREDPTRTVVLVTHNFGQAYDVAQRFVFLRHGRPVFDQRRDALSREQFFRCIEEL